MTVTMFGYLILISIDFYYFISPFSPQIKIPLRRYIKHSRQCLNAVPNNSKFFKNTPRHVVFSTVFSMFGNVVKHGLSYLIFYIRRIHVFMYSWIVKTYKTTNFLLLYHCAYGKVLLLFLFYFCHLTIYLQHIVA